MPPGPGAEDWFEFIRYSHVRVQEWATYRQYHNDDDPTDFHFRNAKSITLGKNTGTESKIVGRKDLSTKLASFFTFLGQLNKDQAFVAAPAPAVAGVAAPALPHPHTPTRETEKPPSRTLVVPMTALATTSTSASAAAGAGLTEAPKHDSDEYDSDDYQSDDDDDTTYTATLIRNACMHNLMGRPCNKLQSDCQYRFSLCSRFQKVSIQNPCNVILINNKTDD